MRGCKFSPHFLSLRIVKHIFNENSVAHGRIAYHNVRHGSDYSAALNDSASAHALNDTACLVYQSLILDLYREAFVIVGCAITLY